MKKSHSNTNLILLIDDNSVDNFINEKILKLSNFSGQINVQSNGKQALEYFKRVIVDNSFTQLPDFIFLDINMPMMDGYEFLDSLLSFSPVFQNMKVVILTNSVNPMDKERSEKYSQIIAYYQKPLTSEILNKLNLNGNP